MAELQDTLGQIEAVDLSEQEDEAVLIDPYETEVTELPAAEGIAEEAALVEGEPGTPSEFEPQPGISTRGLELPYGRGFEDMVLEPELLEEAAPVQPELDLGTKEAPKKKAPTKARRKKKAAYFEKVGVGDKVAALQEAEKAFVKALGKERQESLFASVYGGKEMSFQSVGQPLCRKGAVFHSRATLDRDHKRGRDIRAIAGQLGAAHG
jgi:hypothetical protein